MTSQPTEGPFYPGRFTEDEKEACRKSVLWPMILTMHHAGAGQIYLTWHDSKSFVMSTIHGFTIHKIMLNNNEWKIYDTENLVSRNGSGKPIMMSNHIRYLSRKLGEKENRQRLMDRIKGATGRYQLAESADTFAAALCKYDYRSISLSQNTLLALLKLSAGAIKPEEVEPATMAMIRQEYDTIAEKEKKVESFLKKATEMFGRIKWMVVPVPNYGVIVGAADCTQLIGCAKTEAMTGTHIMPEVFNWIEPLRLYKSWEDIDPRFKDRLMAQLAFCKVHREGQGKKITCIDAQGLVPKESYISLDTNSMTWMAFILNPAMLVDYVV